MGNLQLESPSKTGGNWKFPRMIKVASKNIGRSKQSFLFLFSKLGCLGLENLVFPDIKEVV